MHLTISGLKEGLYYTQLYSFATRLIVKKVNLLLVQRLLGHLSLDSIKICVHFEMKIFGMLLITYRSFV